MYKMLLIFVVIIVLGLAGYFIHYVFIEGSNQLPQGKAMKITSLAFRNEQPIPKAFTCESENINPELVIEDIPGETRSLAMIMDDPDAPSGIFTHWVVWNIPPQTVRIEEGKGNDIGVQGMNSSQKPGYIGPCPPPGKPHRYFFKVYALDKMLDILPGANRHELEAAMMDHLVGSAELIGIYERH